MTISVKYLYDLLSSGNVDWRNFSGVIFCLSSSGLNVREGVMKTIVVNLKIQG